MHMGLKIHCGIFFVTYCYNTEKNAHGLSVYNSDEKNVDVTESEWDPDGGELCIKRYMWLVFSCCFSTVYRVVFKKRGDTFITFWS